MIKKFLPMCLMACIAVSCNNDSDEANLTCVPMETFGDLL